MVSTVTWGLFHSTRTSESGPASMSQHIAQLVLTVPHGALVYELILCLLLITKLSKTFVTSSQHTPVPLV